MELIRISDSKLKVMLTQDDMQHYALNYEEMDYDKTETRKAFWQILDEAKKKTGFDAASDRVFIQVYPSKKGGCEMFVTKVGNGENLPVGHQSMLNCRKRQNIYAFDGLEILLMMCKKLAELGYSDHSEAYFRPDSERYYLVVRERSSDTVLSRNSIGEYCFLSEYGQKKEGAYVLPYIQEHCICLDHTNAVHSLGMLA